jgi:uncharacterized protein YjbJ (UPF0337 family)
MRPRFDQHGMTANDHLSSPLSTLFQYFDPRARAETRPLRRPVTAPARNKHAQGHVTHHQHPMEAGVDWNRVEGNWKQVTGKIKEKWGKLTDDDLANINGKREQLEGKIQERYGIARDQVRKDVDSWYSSQKW